MKTAYIHNNIFDIAINAVMSNVYALRVTCMISLIVCERLNHKGSCHLMFLFAVFMGKVAVHNGEKILFLVKVLQQTHDSCHRSITNYFTYCPLEVTFISIMMATCSKTLSTTLNNFSFDQEIIMCTIELTV